MINIYEGVMDTNLVLPLGPDKCLVLFDFFFGDTSPERAQYNTESVAVSDRVQAEDVGICESVQRGLHSRAYVAGRLSVRRETGEHLFHRLLARDLRRT
jgi:choline monooxygenase